MDIKSLWILVKSHRETLSTIVIGIVLFGAGWQLGRVMSPYYASNPITFNDRPCTDQASSGGTKQELQALATEVQNKVTTSAKKPVAPKVAAAKADIVPSTVAVASMDPEEVLVSTMPTTAATENMFAASKSSNKYHHKDCSTWKRIKPENLIWFSTREQAEAAGYEPTACTKQKLGI
jgi:hypothetical protein